MPNTKIPILLSILFATSVEAQRPEWVEAAAKNGKLAQEALVRSHRVLDAYLKRLDPVTGLLPRRGGQDVWYVRDSAADLYPFLVMAAYYTDHPVYEGAMQEILRNEIRYSTRVGMLSDNVLFGGGFEEKEIDLERLIFGSSEYAKDGLLPLTELLGHHGWYERMRGIADDLIEHAPHETAYGRIPALSDEVNGDILQVLARLAYSTGERRYADQAIRIADFYFKEVIPKSNGLPPEIWDLENGRPAKDRIGLADHGNEIVGGLSEIVLYLKETGNPKFAEFEQPMTDLIDLLLEVGLNEDSVWYLSIEPSSRKVLDARHAHCWGYLYNAVYTTYLITGEERFLEATKRALRSVTEKPHYLDDPEGSGRNYGSNAYSDSIESAIVFLNRLPDKALFDVLDTCVSRFLSRQREDGIIEDWYGDGNYVRTALMYALMKSQGAWLEPWRGDLALGAAPTESGVGWILSAQSPWVGRLRFDRARHREYLNLPVNYPRLNEFPEWFTVEADRLYRLEIGGENSIRSGAELIQGIELALKGNDDLAIVVRFVEGPPYGTEK